ncbi:DNA polymerase III subunit delta' [Candidatus Photodesmus katoptron]|uniref:DNA polymerase III subunit delta' n=1 Tax=Candidatus Photodesmus katoptron Akat1 TaxID=1236703 RepID=S3DKI2_9GAMM|nr:DNA polymerase III subunit delta' C-terminal domain-containing protein [Candidatus Photodesmus katoptron]EPE37639.1 DNA polymerase III, delta subunit [Candidatus Photodesmus katoptron Akat1]KEY90641.1 DNA polymerase III subunit delta' [Candidatus Photodesmus katoptron]
MENLYPWLKDIWHYWKLSLETAQFPNVVLLNSVHGLGSEQLIKHLTQVLMCSNYLGDYCGFCHSCKLVESGNHPDFHLISPEINGGGISINQIRFCNKIACETSQFSGFRLIVVMPAEAMNESASNALLKTLETSPSNCIFLLVSFKPNLLLPTIKSRCQCWNVSIPEHMVLLNWLKSKTKEDIPGYTLHLNNYAPIDILTFIQTNELETYLMIEQKLISAMKNDLEELINLTKCLLKDPNKYLAWLWYLFTDAQKSHFGLIDEYTIPGAIQLSRLLNYNDLYTQTAKLNLLRKEIRLHPVLNKELLITNWLINLTNEIST